MLIFSIGDNITIDFHYQTASIVKYRTDVTFGALDLMVSFGGIAGLFLGCSILSGVEIVYYLMLIALMVIKKVKISLSKFLTKRIDNNVENKIQHNIKLISNLTQFDKDKDIIKAQKKQMKNYKTRY